MASTSPDRSTSSDLAAGVLAPQHYRPPTAQELRSQALHRLQVGILGLASMLLLVSLASIIMDRARVNEKSVAGTTTAAPQATTPVPRVEKKASDPLADIGVVPDLPDDPTPAVDAGQPPVLDPIASPLP